MQVRVHDFEVSGNLDVAGADFAGAFGFQAEGAAAVTEGAEADLFEVEEELGGVFLHTFDGRELMLDLIDADARDRRAFKRA